MSSLGAVGQRRGVDVVVVHDRAGQNQLQQTETTDTKTVRNSASDLTKQVDHYCYCKLFKSN